jgi:hypothetical protein
MLSSKEQDALLVAVRHFTRQCRVMRDLALEVGSDPILGGTWAVMIERLLEAERKLVESSNE